jgi:hypothetical protein
VKHPGDNERRENYEHRAREQNAAQTSACLTPGGVAGFPEEHDGQEDFEDDVRRQADTLNFVQFVGGHNADSQANEYQHNGGGYPYFMGEDITQKNCQR